MSFIRRALAHVEGPMTAEHSPLPWCVLEPDEYVEADRCRGIVDARGVPVVTTDSGVYDPDLATAYFIVRAVNNHEALLAALKSLLDWAGGVAEYADVELAQRCNAARAAIAQAEAR